MKLPDRVAFTIPGTEIDIYWYAILIAAGIIAAVIVAGICAKKRRLPGDVSIDLCLVTVPLGIIFARLYYILFNLSDFTTLSDWLSIRDGGLAIPGGIIGGLIGLLIYSLVKKKSLLTYADIIAPGLALAQAIGRWGNFFNQEAYGLAVNNPKYMFFPFAVKIEDCNCVPGQHGHLATFFYESMACLLIFIILLIAFKKVKHRGDIIFTYALLYSFERFFIEGLRTDSLMLGGIKITQLLCAVVFVAVAAFLIIRAIIEKKHPERIHTRLADEIALDESALNDEENCEEEFTALEDTDYNDQVSDSSSQEIDEARDAEDSLAEETEESEIESDDETSDN